MVTARHKEHTGDGHPAELVPAGHDASQTDGLRVLLSIAVTRPVDGRDETAIHDERASRSPRDLVPDLAGLPATELAPDTRPSHQRRTGRAAAGGRHAASPPPYLDRRGSRFVVFSAIGGFIFLMGLGLQAELTGNWRVLPVVSYLIQAVVSVEASFLLNRWLTWRDRSTRIWLAFARFNAQKTVTIALNLALYAGLLRLGMNYLVANVVLTAVFTVVNYVAGDRLVFIPGRTRAGDPATPAVPVLARDQPRQRVSAVIPCRNNERTIGSAVRCLLDQDYPGLSEIMLIGSPGDTTWRGLVGISHPRLTVWELETPPGVRDANFKRDAAIRMTSGGLIALVDSDIVLPPDWMSRAVAALENSGVSCVAGGMRSIHDSFWGRYTDSTWIGAKTPRIADSYTVTSTDFGARGRKPPILANTLFTRELYDHCPIDPFWSHGSYEDYEWFWRVVRAGYGIRVCWDLFGWHHHRRGLRALASEYRRSSRGCAYFIRAHLDSPLAKRRLRQAIVLPLAAIAAAVGATAAVADGYVAAVAGLVLGCAAVLAVHQVVRSRSLESMVYPVVGLALGLVFTTGLVANLIRPRSAVAASGVPSPTLESQTEQPPDRLWRRLVPVTAICAVQAALSLTLVWSNTAYTDEADYLWVGRLEIAHWLHGTTWPSMYAYRSLSGSPVIYPPLGALANSAGCLAGARILSLGFMILATALLYLTASRLIGRPGAIFAAGLWAFSEPAIRLAFATIDPLSVLLTTVAAWFIVQAGCRRRRGELVAAAAVTLALANVTAYSGIFIDPVVIGFALLAWRTRMQVQQALSCAAWLTAAWLSSFGLLMTALHSWLGLFSTVLAQNVAGYQGIASVLSEVWGYSALIFGLAAIGAVVSLKSERRNHVALLGGLCFLVFIVAQLHDQTAWSIDEHLAYGMWFAAIVAGYACSKLVRWVPGTRRQLAVLCCATAFAYPAVVSWQSAWERYHSWPNAEKLIGDFKPIAAEDHGQFYLPGNEVNIAEYYTPQGYDWTRWGGALSLDPVAVPKNTWSSYYSTQLSNGSDGVIVLFYATTFSSVRLPQSILLPNNAGTTYKELLSLVGSNSGEPGLAALTAALEEDNKYRLARVGPYSTSNISGTHYYGTYAIWQKVQT